MEEAKRLAHLLRGMVECGSAPDDLWDRDQPDGDPFVARAAEILDSQRDEIETMKTEIDVLRADCVSYEADLKAMKHFADLWYFVMDEKPRSFEKIVNEWSSEHWMRKASELMKETRNA